MTQSSTIHCARCSKSAAPPGEVPYFGELAAEIRLKACATCWSEWLEAEVKIINELRLDFMNPESQDVLMRHMRDFLVLDGKSDGTTDEMIRAIDSKS